MTTHQIIPCVEPLVNSLNNLMSHHEHDISVSGGVLRVAVNGSGIPLICVHGWTMNASMWRYQIDLVGNGVQLVTYDRRGYGLSTAPVEPSQEVDDIEAIRNKLNLPKINLLGMSQGGRICLRYASQYTNQTSSLLLLGTSVDGFDGDPEPADQIPLKEYSDLIVSEDLTIMRSKWLAHPLMETNCQKVKAHLKDMVSDYLGRDLKPAPAPEQVLSTDLSAIDCPALIMAGGKEPTHIQNITAHLQSEIGARCHIFRGQGHFSNMTVPQDFNQIIGTFLKSLKTQP